MIFALADDKSFSILELIDEYPQPIVKVYHFTAAKLLFAQARTPNIAPHTSQDIVITYGPFERSLTVAELTALAETGEVSRSLRSLLGLVKISPENVRQVLNKRVKVDVAFLDKNLNNILGEFALFEVGQIFHTGSGQGNIQALRSALILSARDDNYISPIEFLQNYPLPQMYINAVKLLKLKRLTKNAASPADIAANEAQSLESFLVNVQASIAAEVCSCGK